MLSYELYKQLKEAGFPQGEGSRLLPEGMSVLLAGRELLAIAKKIAPELLSPAEAEEYYVYKPSLSELIAACGRRFRDLKMQYHAVGDSYTWLCNQTADDACLDCNPEGWDEWEAKGSTPEEAVARLYLEFNQ
jgi:hypothetical protein